MSPPHSLGRLLSGRLGQLGGLLFLQVVSAVGFVLGGPPEDTIFWNGLFDVGHALLFGFVTWTALRAVELWFAPKRPPFFVNLAVFGGLLLAAALSELLQRYQPTRHPSLSDFFRDAAGAGAMFLFRTTTDGPRRRKSVQVRRGLACTFIFLVLAEFGMTLALYAQRDRAFPVLLSFEGRWWERRLLRVHGGELSSLGRTAAGSPACAQLILRPGRVPALTFEEPYPDWTHAGQLAFSVRSDNDDPFRLRVRVSDAQYNGEDEDAFYKDLDLTKGEHRIEIPIEQIRHAPVYRTLDMTRIRNITFFVWRPRQTIHMCMSPLRLE